MEAISVRIDFKTFKTLSVNLSKLPNDLGLFNDATLQTDTEKNMWVHEAYAPLPKVLKSKVKIVEIACNMSISVLLSSKHEVWVLGTDNLKSGLFGLENFYQSDQPVRCVGLIGVEVVGLSIASTHAAAVSSTGLLYIWGSGHSNELGTQGLDRTMPYSVPYSNIFVLRQVACGKGFTAVVTEGGYVYVYSSKHYKNHYNYPFIVSSLQKHFITKIHSFYSQIIALNELEQCFALKNSDKIYELQGTYKINQIAVCSEGVIGLCREQSGVYAWSYTNKEWSSKLYAIKNGIINKVSSSPYNYIEFIGHDLSSSTFKFIANETIKDYFFRPYNNVRKKSFEEIFDSFGKTPETKFLGKGLLFELIKNRIEKIQASAISDIKLYLFSSYAYKKVCKSIFVPLTIIKALQRLMIIRKYDCFLTIKFLDIKKELNKYNIDPNHKIGIVSLLDSSISDMNSFEVPQFISYTARITPESSLKHDYELNGSSTLIKVCSLNLLTPYKDFNPPLKTLKYKTLKIELPKKPYKKTQEAKTPVISRKKLIRKNFEPRSSLPKKKSLTKIPRNSLPITETTTPLIKYKSIQKRKGLKGYNTEPATPFINYKGSPEIKELNISNTEATTPLIKYKIKPESKNYRLEILSDFLNVTIPNSPKALNFLCDLIFRVFKSRVSDCFGVIKCISYKHGFEGLNSRKNSFLLVDSWRSKLHVLGLRKFDITVGNLIQKYNRFAFTELRVFKTS